MSSNRLKLNGDKTQFIWLGSWQQLRKVDVDSIQLGSNQLPFRDSVNDLGVTIDSRFTMKGHVGRVCSSAYYHLRQIRAVRKSLDFSACVTLVHAFVTSRLDYCNSILFGITGRLLDRLQSVLRSAARLVMQKPKYASITNDMRDHLHWLPIQQRITFKLCTIVYKCQHKSAPTYLSEMLKSASSVDALKNHRSAARGDLVPPDLNSKTLGRLSFANSGPAVWNTLPVALRDRSLSYTAFKSQLKTFLFTQAYYSL
jgi:hypothetical protein